MLQVLHRWLADGAICQDSRQRNNALAKQPTSCIYFGKAMLGTDVDPIGDVVAGDFVTLAGEKLGKFHSNYHCFTKSWEMALVDANG